jgi:enoyl-CoA hydratase/carnithine racemase
MSASDAGRGGAVVLLAETENAAGQRLGVITLNSEKTLNALSLAMIEDLGPALRRWRADPRIVAVVLHGAGDRAFCAGGDIQALYHSMTRNHAAGRIVDSYAESFFAAEYRLDYLLHTYPKPVVTFGHGVVMGGGLGLFSASRYRLVTDKSRIALPEVTIGLFPDAGATWLLKSIPNHEALFIGATGTHLNGADARHVGLATHAVQSDWSRVRDALMTVRWHGDDRDATAIDQALAPVAVDLATSPLAAHSGPLTDALAELPADAGELGRRLRGLGGDDGWFDRGIATMDKGCPTSVGIVLEQVRRAALLNLADSFRLEMTVATHCARNPEFAEGVRALLIDKDNAPRWRYRALDDLPAGYVAAHFAPPWSVNPLLDLEETS